MQVVKNDDNVRVHYVGSLDDGTIFDSSYDRNEPIEFKIGSGQMIPGFNDAIVGMKVGDKKSIQIESDEAYGPRYEEAIQTIGRELLPQGYSPNKEDVIQVMSNQGTPSLAVVKDVTESALTIDMNHPLAGKDLNFDIELVGIE